MGSLATGAEAIFQYINGYNNNRRRRVTSSLAFEAKAAYEIGDWSNTVASPDGQTNITRKRRTCQNQPFTVSV